MRYKIDLDISQTSWDIQLTYIYLIHREIHNWPIYLSDIMRHKIGLSISQALRHTQWYYLFLTHWEIHISLIYFYRHCELHNGLSGVSQTLWENYFITLSSPTLLSAISAFSDLFYSSYSRMNVYIHSVLSEHLPRLVTHHLITHRLCMSVVSGILK